MKKLLVVVDYQNDFVDGALGFQGADALDEGIAHLAQSYLAMGDHVLFTFDTHGEDYLNTREGKALPVPHCIAGSFGAQLYGKTQALCCETCANSQIYTVYKRTFGMDPQDALRLRKELGDVNEITITGVVTNMCVIANAAALQAAFPEAEITIDAALCRSFAPELHEKALDVMEGMQMNVIHR